MSKTDFQNGFALGMASGGVVEVIDTTEIDALEDLIDESGVLGDAEGTVSEKVEGLIDKAEELDVFQSAIDISFNKATFPSKEKVVINLPNITSLAHKFYNWKAEPIPRVNELIINAPKVNNANNVFYSCCSFKKIVLKLSDNITNLSGAFWLSEGLEEVVLTFSTKNVTNYSSCFNLRSIKTIIGVLDFSSATNVNGVFGYENSLEDVTFEPNSLSISLNLSLCRKLSTESIQSIIDGLKTLEEGATAQTS
jgi:hypothetical protein